MKGSPLEGWSNTSFVPAGIQFDIARLGRNAPTNPAPWSLPLDLVGVFVTDESPVFVRRLAADLGVAKGLIIPALLGSSGTG